MKVLIPMKTQVEQIALQQRLEALGIKVDAQGNVDTKSLDGLRAGELRGQAALESVLEAGYLTHEATEKLTRTGFLGVLTKGAVSERDTNALKSFTMNLDGINKSLEQALTQPFFKAEGDKIKVNNAALEPVKKRILATLDNWNKTLADRGLGQVSAQAVIDLRETLKETMVSTLFLAKSMSEARTSLLSARKHATGVVGFIARPLVQSALDSIEMLENLSKFANWALLAGLAPISLYQSAANDLLDGVFSRQGVKDVVSTLEKLDADTKLGLQTLSKGLGKIIDKNFISIREAKALDLTVLTLEALNELWPRNLDEMAKLAKDGDLYAAIGANRDATAGDLQRCYRLAAKLYHPDAAGERMSPELFDLAKKAYDQLKDSAKRADFDERNPMAGKSYRFRSLLEDPSRLMSELVRSDAAAAALKTEKGLIELFSSIAAANPTDPKAFLRAIDEALLRKAGEPPSVMAGDLEKARKANGVIQGDYSPENIGRAIRTAFESLGGKETQGLVTRTLARAQILVQPKGVVDEEVYAHDAKFVATVQDLKARLGFTVQGLNADEQRYAIGTFYSRLEGGNIPPAAVAALPATQS